MENKIARKIAWLLPPTVLLWAFIRATSIDSQSPDSSYKRIYDTIVKKYNLKGW